jgi:hypothetical protein
MADKSCKHKSNLCELRKYRACRLVTSAAIIDKNNLSSRAEYLSRAGGGMENYGDAAPISTPYRLIKSDVVTLRRFTGV